MCNMSIIAAVLAVIIFANPYISVLDLLPDVFGCLLIWFATAHISFFSPKIEEARRLWLRLALLTGIDALLSYVIPANDGTMRLLLVFVFRISGGALLYLAATKTFDGMLYLGTKFDGVGIYVHGSKRKAARAERRETEEREKLDRILEHEREKYERGTAEGTDEEHRHRATERYRRAVAKISADANRTQRSRDGLTALSHSTLIFVIVRTAMCVLPEFTALSFYERLGDVPSGYAFNIANYRGMFISLGFIIALIVSVFWLVRMLRYIIGIGHDHVFIVEVRQGYADFTKTHSDLYLSRRVMASLVLLGIGVFLTFDFFVENINFIPDFAAAAFFLAFFLVIPKDGKKTILGIVLSVAYGVLSAACWIYVFNYINQFGDFTRTIKSEAAFTGHIVCSILMTLSELIFIALAVLIYREVTGLIGSHTGYKSDLGVIDERTAYLREAFKKANKRSLVFAILTAVAAAVYMISLGINKQVLVRDETLEYYIYVPAFESMGAINSVIMIVFLITTIKLISDIYDSVKERYKFI